MTALAIAGVLVGSACEGCKQAPPAETITQTVENAAAVAQYGLMLDACRAKGKDAGSYAVYEACADAIDSEICHHQQVRCAH